MRSKSIFTVILSIFLYHYSICQDCTEILKYGIYDQDITKVDQSRATWYVYKFIKDNFATYSQAKSMDASAAIPIDDILIGLNFSQNDNGFAQLKTYIDSYFSLQLDEKYKLERVTSTINANIVNAWLQCSGRPGPHFFIVFTEDPKVFKLCGYDAYDGGQVPRITSGGFDRPAGIRVSTDLPFFAKDKTLRKIRLPVNRQFQTFERLDGKAISLTINFSFGNSVSLDIPAISSLNTSESVTVIRKEIALTTEWSDNVDIPSNHNCTLKFAGLLKFFDPIAPPGQNPRLPALNSDNLSIQFPANILEYKIVTLDASKKIISEEPVNRWDGSLVLINKSNHVRRLQTRVLLYWLDSDPQNRITVKTPTHAQDFFIANYTHNVGPTNLSSQLSVER